MQYRILDTFRNWRYMKDLFLFVFKLMIIAFTTGVLVMYLLKLIGEDHTYAYYVPIFVGFIMLIKKYGKK